MTNCSQTEEELQQANIIIENSPVVLFRWRASTGWPVELVSSNVKQFGYSAEELLSGTVAYSSIVHPDDLGRVAQEVEQYSDNGINEFTQEYRIVSPEGRTFWIDDRTTVERDGDGNIVYYQGIVLDITERKKAEEQYRQLFERTGTAMAVLDPDGTLSLVNKTFAQLAEADESELLGRSFLEGVADADKARMQQYHLKRLRGEEAPENYEFQFRTLKGRDGWGLLNLSFFPDSGKTVASTIDITERKEAEKERERLQRELHQTHKMESLGQLAGGIAHEFNNILGIIMGYTGMTLERYGQEIPEKMAENLETVVKASQRAKTLVSQMLAFSRTQEIEAQPMHLQPLIREDIKILRSSLPSTIEITSNIDEDLPAVLIDPNQLSLMLLNLCINARDAMDGKGKITICLCWHRDIDGDCSACGTSLKGDWIELAVTDDGSGMTPYTLEHLFVPFFTTKDVGEGTGMGMPLLHGFMRAHDGHILIDTELGKGSTIRMLFRPFTEEYLIAPEEPAQSADKLTSGAAHQVLVVDDEPELAHYIGELMELNDYKVTINTDSEKALQLLREEPDKFSLLITDQTMPHLTGVELIRQLRKIRPEIPAILCTGYSEEIAVDEADNMNICYLGKPVDSKKLVQLAGRLVGVADIE